VLYTVHINSLCILQGKLLHRKCIFSSRTYFTYQCYLHNRSNWFVYFFTGYVWRCTLI